MNLTYKSDSSFFMYVKPPGTYVGVNILRRWFQESPSAKFRLIVDKELDDNFSNLKEISEFYPGIKTFAVVVNPWARIKIIYDDLSRIESPISHMAGCDFELFISKLSDIETNTNWPFSFSPLASQVDWLEYIDSAGNLQTVDYVLKSENLEQEFKVIQDYFICHTPLDSAVEIPNYRDCYNDRTRSIVAEYFKKDIERFNYEF